MSCDNKIGVQSVRTISHIYLLLPFVSDSILKKNSQYQNRRKLTQTITRGSTITKLVRLIYSSSINVRQYPMSKTKHRVSMHLGNISNSNSCRITIVDVLNVVRHCSKKKDRNCKATAKWNGLGESHGWTVLSQNLVPFAVLSFA